MYQKLLTLFYLYDIILMYFIKREEKPINRNQNGKNKRINKYIFKTK